MWVEGAQGTQPAPEVDDDGRLAVISMFFVCCFFQSCYWHSGVKLFKMRSVTWRTCIGGGFPPVALC